tara:strand:+ start:627 stop:944 length:318 start_codon:yes stop_codon:yes gene_type:complete
MATTKVKGTSKKIKELRGVEDIRPEKITDDQLIKLRALVKDINLSHHEIGVVEAKKHSMMHILVEKQNDLLKVQKELEKEYGTLDIDINDGTIKYEEDGEVNKED